MTEPVAAQPLVSVALCTRNGEPYLGAQLASILEQTVAVAELVVSDDASWDDTLEVVRGVVEAAPVDVRPALTVLRNEPPLGVTKNFEQAVRAAGGGVIALSDQDDLWHAEKLARALAVLLPQGADAASTPLLVHSDARLVDAAGEPLGATLFQQLELAPAELAVERGPRPADALLRRNLATGATIVFRRELLEAALPFPSTWVHDEWLAVIAAALGRIAVIDEPLIDYRQHGANEIGVDDPTFAYKIRRVLGERGERNAVLAAKFEALVPRLEALGAAVEPRVLASARAKARFERRRAAMPAARWRRVPTVVALAVRGRYGRFASRGLFDIVRDLLQPA